MQDLQEINRKGLKTLIRRKWYVFILALIGILSFSLNFYAISKYGYGNEYYAAAIKSMTQSFKNFFFVSFDPAGFVSVDKPPLGLWIQAIFVLIFGYHGWAMLLPQALAGTGACIMLYILTSKIFGRVSGLISSLIFAITPVVVVASRNNTMDMQLILVLLAAVWFLFRSIEKGRWRYLFIAAVFIGLGFNIKMLQAYMILPAFALVYLIFAKGKLCKRFTAGLISVVIMAAVSFVWVFAVDLYPSDSRPYVDSSTNNTVLELIIGHNGLERIYGQGSGGGGQNMGTPPNGLNQPDGNNNQASVEQGNNNSSQMPQNGTNNGQQSATNQGGGGGFAQMPQNGGAPPSGMGGQQNGNQNIGTPPSGLNHPGGGNRGGGGQGGEIGSASILRLWNSSLYGQGSWLLLFAICGIAVSIRRVNIRELTLKQGAFAFWILWLTSMYVFFSFAGFYHRYYLCMLAPAIAVLSGVGLVRMVQEFSDKSSWRKFMLPISLLATLGIELVYVWSYTALRSWLIPIMAAAGLASLIFMLVHLVNPKKFAITAAAVCLMVSILAAPFYWALTPVIYVPNSTMPYAGPELASQVGGDNMPHNNNGNMSQTPDGKSQTSNQTKISGLEKYLVSNYKAGSYLVVSQRANDVAQLIIDTGLPAVSYGGFLGSDNSLSVDKLKDLVAQGKIRYFLLSDKNGNTNSELVSYVKKNATLIDPSEYGESSNQQDGGGASSLYLFK